MGGAVEQVVVVVISFVVVVLNVRSLYVRRSSSCVLNGSVKSKVRKDGVFHAPGDGHPDSIGVLMAYAVFEVVLVVFEVVVHFLVKRVTVVAPVYVGAGIKVVVLAVTGEVVVYIIRKVGESLVGSAGGGGRVFGDE